MSNNIKKLFKNIKLLILDVDGVLTKGEIIYDDEGRELKIFNVKDGLGIFFLKKIGIKTIIVTAKKSSIVEKRAKDMDVEEVIGGILPKESVLESIKNRYKVKEEEICFIGDDLLDLGIMKKVGIPITVQDAPQIMKKVSRYITKQKGGEGAVREVVDIIIKSKNLWKEVYKLIS